MASKKSTASKRRKARPSSLSSYSVTMVITRNLANMATVIASSGSVLLALLIAKRF